MLIEYKNPHSNQTHKNFELLKEYYHNLKHNIPNKPKKTPLKDSIKYIFQTIINNFAEWIIGNK